MPGALKNATVVEPGCPLGATHIRRHKRISAGKGRKSPPGGISAVPFYFISISDKKLQLPHHGHIRSQPLDSQTSTFKHHGPESERPESSPTRRDYNHQSPEWRVRGNTGKWRREQWAGSTQTCPVISGDLKLHNTWKSRYFHEQRRSGGSHRDEMIAGMHDLGAKARQGNLRGCTRCNHGDSHEAEGGIGRLRAVRTGVSVCRNRAWTWTTYNGGVRATTG
jgi:hypothetical protein